MKLFIVCLLFVALAKGDLTSEQQKKLQQDNKECLGSSGVAPDLLEKVRKDVFTDDAKLKEHLFCLFKKIGFQNNAGQLQRTVLFEKINAALKDPATVNKLLDACAVQKQTPQDTAFNSLKCYSEKSQKRVHLI